MSFDREAALPRDAAGRAAFERLRAMMRRYAARLSPPTGEAVERLSERDAILITYGDQVQSPHRPPLRVLTEFCNKHLTGLVSGIHILPFYPWTSDDGFSVKNYRAVDPALGGWQDLTRLGRRFRLMYDAVINHVSARHPWFRGFLLGDPRFQNHFLVVEGDPDLSQVVRPRALPPLTLHTLRTGDARALSEWAATLRLPSQQTTFFNFLASHDGIGLNPARGILPQSDIDALVQRTLDHGGLVSYKHNPDGSQSPYELNINYFDALNHPESQEPLALQVERFIAAQAIMLSLVGVPGIYFHSLFGSRGWPRGVQLTGRNRTINRQKCDRAELERELARPGALRRMVFAGYKQLLEARARIRNFGLPGKSERGGDEPLTCVADSAQWRGTLPSAGLWSASWPGWPVRRATTPRPPAKGSL